MYYFDQNGKSLSIPSGLKNYYKDKDYLFLITTYIPLTQSFINVTYRISLRLPDGLSPVVNLQ
jgi:hypothetical protein